MEDKTTMVTGEIIALVPLSPAPGRRIDVAVFIIRYHHHFLLHMYAEAGLRFPCAKAGSTEMYRDTAVAARNDVA